MAISLRQIAISPCRVGWQAGWPQAETVTCNTARASALVRNRPTKLILYLILAYTYIGIYIQVMVIRVSVCKCMRITWLHGCKHTLQISRYATCRKIYINSLF